MSNPLVSIVICCHNRAHLLPQTMESVFAQDYRPVEIVILDDGSTDNTPDLMKSYGARVRYYWQANRGVAAARTAACQLAKGEFIAFQDDDDLMPPDRIVLLYEALCRNPSAVFASGDWAVIDVNGNLTGKRSKASVKPKNEETILIEDGYLAVLWPIVTTTPHTSLFRRTDGERIGWFDTRFFHACEDTDFFARLGRLGPIVYVPKVVSLYRQTDNMLTSNDLLLAYSKLLLFVKHLLSLDAEQSSLRKRLQLRLLRKVKRLRVHQSAGGHLPNSFSPDYLKKAITLLGLKNRLLYAFFTNIYLPLNTIKRRVNRTSNPNYHL